MKRIRNECIRGRAQGERFGGGQRRDSGYAVRRMMKMELLSGRRKRPQRRLMDAVKEDMQRLV